MPSGCSLRAARAVGRRTGGGQFCAGRAGHGPIRRIRFSVCMTSGRLCECACACGLVEQLDTSARRVGGVFGLPSDCAFQWTGSLRLRALQRV